MTDRQLAMQRFRKVNPRLDYFPTPEAATAIAQMQLTFPSYSKREVVDMLVVEGIKSFFPERNTHPSIVLEKCK